MAKLAPSYIKILNPPRLGGCWGFRSLSGSTAYLLLSRNKSLNHPQDSSSNYLNSDSCYRNVASHFKITIKPLI